MGTFNTGLTLCRRGSTADDPGATAFWTNPGNITLSDDTYAISTSAGGAATSWLVASNFGFTIPTQCKIIGTIMNVSGNSSGVAPAQVIFTNIGMGTNLGFPHVPVIVTTLSTTAPFFQDGNPFIYGQVSPINNVWGLDLTPYAVNSPDFQARIQLVLLTSGFANVDAFWMSIVYTDPATATSGNTQITVQSRMAGY